MNIREFRGIKPKIDESCYVDLQSCIIGDVEIGANSSIWPMVSIRGDMLKITIGANTSIQDGAVLHTTHKSKFFPDGFALKIGDGVTVGHKATLHGCTVGDNCIIGIDATVLDGAVIEEEVILAAGSVVPPGKVCTSGYLWIGAPAKPVRQLTEDEVAFICYNAANYVKLKDEYLKA